MIDIEPKNIYCYRCNIEKPTAYVEKERVIDIFGNRTKLKLVECVCSKCSESMVDDDINIENQIRINVFESKAKNVISAKELQLFRRLYGFSQKELANKFEIELDEYIEFENGKLVDKKTNQKIMKTIEIIKKERNK